MSGDRLCLQGVGLEVGSVVELARLGGVVLQLDRHLSLEAELVIGWDE